MGSLEVHILKEPATIVLSKALIVLLLVLPFHGGDHVAQGSRGRQAGKSIVDRPLAPTALSEDSTLPIIGRWAWGPSEAVDVKGNLAFLGNGSTFQVLDISDGSAPRLLGEVVTSSKALDIRVRDTFAYVATGNSLRVIDVSNQVSPRVISEVVTGNQITKIALSDSIAFVAGPGDFVQAINISDPWHPSPRGSYRPITGGRHADFLGVRGHVVYFIDGDFTILFMIDASNPDTLRNEQRHVGFFGFATAGTVCDSLLLLCIQGGGVSPEVLICSVATPDSPYYLSFAAVSPSVTRSIVAEGQAAYVASSTGEVVTIDISNPSSPLVVERSMPLPSELIGGRAIAKSGPNLVVAQSSGIRMFDAGMIYSLRSLSFYPTGGWPFAAHVRQNLAFVASQFSGLWILDISDPIHPKAVSNVNVGGYAVDVIATDSVAYVANLPSGDIRDTTQGLWIIDVSDIRHPVPLSHHVGIARHPLSEGEMVSIGKEGDMVIMTQTGSTSYDSTLEVIDVHDPARPVTQGIVRSPTRAMRVALKDSIAFVADADSGLRIIDIHRPDHPAPIARVPGSTVGVTIRDSLAYVLGDSIWVVDIQRPYSPVVLSSKPVGPNPVGRGDAIAVGRWLYWVHDGALGMADISNPADIVPLQGFARNGGIYGVAANDSIVVVCDIFGGVWILRANTVTSIASNRVASGIPTMYELAQNYPNPFNPITTIRYGLPRRSDVSLVVYNVLGQKVGTLVRQAQKAGYYEVKFDGSSLSSGIYFYCLRVGNSVLTRKLLLVR